MKDNSDRPETAIFTAHEDFSQTDPTYAEKSLMTAILWSVFDDLKKQGQEYREARSYVLSNDTRYIYSFRNVCLHLGLSYTSIRSLLGLTKSQASEQDSTLN